MTCVAMASFVGSKFRNNYFISINKKGYTRNEQAAVKFEPDLFRLNSDIMAS